jgi:hypothetical protein
VGRYLERVGSISQDPVFRPVVELGALGDHGINQVGAQIYVAGAVVPVAVIGILKAVGPKANSVSDRLGIRMSGNSDRH